MLPAGRVMHVYRHFDLVADRPYELVQFDAVLAAVARASGGLAERLQRKRSYSS